MSPTGKLQVMTNYMVSLWRDEQGQDLIEYALLIAFLALLSTVSLQVAGQKISTIFSKLANGLP